MRNIIYIVLLQINLLYALEVSDKEKKIFLDKIDTSEYQKDFQKNSKCKISITEFQKTSEMNDTKTTQLYDEFEFKRKDTEIENDAALSASVIEKEEFNKKFNEAKNHLLHDEKLNWKEQEEIAQKHIDEKGEGEDFYINSDKTLYLFISSSIPRTTLVNYLESTKYINSNIVFVLQGAIGGLKKIAPTMEWMKDLMGDEYNNARIIIEPRIAKKFEIDRVPALLYTQSSFFDESKTGDSWLFYGDMPLVYALKKMNEKKEDLFLTKMIKKLETL